MSRRDGKVLLWVVVLCIATALWGHRVPIYARRIVPLIWQMSYLIVASVSLNLVVGSLGQLSLGHCGFMAIGAYTAALLSLWAERQGIFQSKAGILYLMVVLAAIVAGGVLAGIGGLCIGIPALRLKGDYLAIITLGFGMIVVNVINNLPFAGMNGLEQGSASSVLYKTGLGFTNIMLNKWLWLPLLITGLCLWLVQNLLESNMGRNIRAICDDYIGASASGIDVPGCKIRVFALSAGLAGVAGGLYACFMTTLTTSTFGFSNNGILSSSFLVAICVMGGLGSLRSTVVSATAMCLLNYLIGQMGLSALPGPLGQLFSYPMLTYGIALMAILLWEARRKKC